MQHYEHETSVFFSTVSILTKIDLLAHEELLPTVVKPVGTRSRCYPGGIGSCTGAGAPVVMVLVIGAEGHPIVISKPVTEITKKAVG
jgi:hypothetical protein